ncbi:uncharacterized protein LY79DRAFT_583151 [Colletotrichum navitas]|uniref:Uncharacterized protein n=1 Tax=Colletotrichum navitas TaxID=681940 RepID=A0AAD8PPV0_9PEZI|nr:uncharacterized protein LY79DRAFT_583151 [Colletotrichum navitas]KAK1574195.1 hypothetical protein LY79DRAFT_583151 [Colletotrichum navitas]
MGSKNINKKQAVIAEQSSAVISASYPKAPNKTFHLKSLKLGSELESTIQGTAGNPETNNSAENDNTVDISYEKLERLEHRIFKSMYADRKNRLMEIYFSRMGSKVQWSRSKKARRLAKHRCASRDEKRGMD